MVGPLWSLSPLEFFFKADKPLLLKEKNNKIENNRKKEKKQEGPEAHINTSNTKPSLRLDHDPPQ